MEIYRDFVEFIDTLPILLKLLFIALISMIPLVESYFGSFIGIASGVNWILAIGAASLGNFLSMLLVVKFSNVLYRKFFSKKFTPKSKKMKRFNRFFDKYGIIGVSLLGQTFLPSQITAGLMVVAGGDKNKIILWQTVSIIMWGTIFGLLALAGVNLLRA